MFSEEPNLNRMDVLTFKHREKNTCEHCSGRKFQQTPPRNDFDDELEKGLQARVLFQKEEWREELKKEMNQEVSSLKSVPLVSLSANF